MQTTDYAQGRVYDFQGPEKIDTQCLEAFAYEGNKQLITCTTEEFSAVCPFSGLPDIARVSVSYIPDKLCIELKSLKYYYMSFRNVGIYQEAATDRIFSDLFSKLSPRYMKVVTDYNTRGGIDTVCEIEKGEK